MASIVLEIVCAAFPNVLAGMIIRKTKTWTENEEENHEKTKKIFATKSGDWVFISGSAYTMLKKGGNQVGSLNDFNPDTASAGDSGSGYSTEKNVDFHWTVSDRAKAPKHAKKSA